MLKVLVSFLERVFNNCLFVCLFDVDCSFNAGFLVLNIDEVLVLITTVYPVYWGVTWVTATSGDLWELVLYFTKNVGCFGRFAKGE
jgi:hypothetical protein